MNITKSLMLAAVAATPIALGLAAPVQAQVAGIATAEPALAIARSRAYTAAAASIQTTFKAQFDQIATQQTARQAALAKIDTNGDRQVDDNEIAAAQAAKNPALAEIQRIDQQIATIAAPVIRAQMFVIDNITNQYENAQQAVVTARKINVILASSAFLYAPDAVDVTTNITTELDRLLPSVPVTPPANFQPTRANQQLLQQVEQYRQLIAAQAGRTPAPSTTTPAPAAPAPAARPPAGR